MADDLGSLFTGRRLNYRQIETVIGILLEAASGFGKLDEEGTGLTFTA